MTEVDSSGKLLFQSLQQDKCLSSHMEKKIHLFHWTKKSFSVLNVLPLTGEVMGLDHVHLHAAVNQESHSPHAAKTLHSSSCGSVKQHGEALPPRTCGKALHVKRLRISAQEEPSAFFSQFNWASHINFKVIPTLCCCSFSQAKTLSSSLKAHSSASPWACHVQIVYSAQCWAGLMKYLIWNAKIRE